MTISRSLRRKRASSSATPRVYQMRHGPAFAHANVEDVLIRLGHYNAGLWLVDIEQRIVGAESTAAQDHLNGSDLRKPNERREASPAERQCPECRSPRLCLTVCRPAVGQVVGVGLHTP
jgi:hypothetical protein